MQKIAAIQMCSSRDHQANLVTASRLITQAAHQGAKLVVLPEMFTIVDADDSAKLQVGEPYGQGIAQQTMADLACQLGVWIVAGTLPITTGDPHKVRAACLVYNDQGEVVARYDKVHLFDAELSAEEAYRESHSTEAGTEHAVVVQTPLGKVGLAVCYDIRFPEQFIGLAKAGAEIIVLPAAFTKTTGKAHWHLLSRCRAIDSFCYFVGATQGGDHDSGRQTFGHSLIVNPWGEVVAEAPQAGDSIVYHDVDLRLLKDIRQRIPLHQHRLPAILRAVGF